MSKGYFNKVIDLLDKMTGISQKVLDVLHTVDPIVYKKKPSELNDQEVEELQNVIIQANRMLVDYNGKVSGDWC